MDDIGFLTLYSGCIRKNNLVEMYIFCEVGNTLLRSSIIAYQQMHQYYLLFKIGFNPWY
jgi:hypothetical protein